MSADSFSALSASKSVFVPMTSSVLLAETEFYLVVMVGEQENQILPLVRAIPSLMSVADIKF